jgi:hypothetical protein
MREHRWSGWPGAFCLDCGAPDQQEICVAEHDVVFHCAKGHFADLNRADAAPVCEQGHPLQSCAEHVNLPCPGAPPGWDTIPGC